VKKLTIVISLILLLISPQAASAEYGVIPESAMDPSVVKIDEEKYLGTRLSGDFILIDESGKEFQLRDITGRPIILLLSYFSCDGLCPTANQGLKDALSAIDRLKIGEDFMVLTLSFDKIDSVQSIRMFSEMAGLKGWSGKGWKVAILKDGEDIESLTGDVGFKFFWSSRDKMFLHPNVFIFLSPEGRVVRYLYGTPPKTRDVELALTEAAEGKAAGSGIIDFVNMACYSFNFKEGRYTINIPIFIGIGSLLLGISSIVVPVLILRRRKEAGS